MNKFAREEIADNFYSYETEGGRLKFVQLLRDQKIKPEGEWPHGRLPNIKNDEASTLLAKLEEKWLGLDR